MKPNIYRFADVVDGTDVYEKIKDAIINNRMIPVLGSGFSYGFKANNGTVPSVNDLKEKIKQELIEDEEYDEYDAEELERFDLSFGYVYAATGRTQRRRQSLCPEIFFEIYGRSLL